MGREIYKYNLASLAAMNTFGSVMPVGASPLWVELNDGVFRVWALVDPDVPPTVTRRIHIAGTGHPMPSEFSRETLPRHLNTFFVPTGDPKRPLVFHAFDMGAPEPGPSDQQQNEE